MQQSKALVLLTDRYPDIRFVAGASYHWSPADQTVYYMKHDTARSGLWALLHETSHGLLGHKKYRSDFELLLLELDAWEHANQLADEINITTGEAFDEHKEDCLDSYRDWQHKRSLCPQCNLVGLQVSDKQYKCLFCNKAWTVSAARYRLSRKLR